MAYRSTVSPSAQRVLDGLEDLSTWDDEELRFGRRRSSDGTFRGQRPRSIPRALHDELYRRTIEDAGNMLRESLPDAVKVVVELAKDPQIESNVRLRAAQYVIDRVAGKTPDRVELKAEPAVWEQLLTDVKINRELPAPTADEDNDIVDAEVVEDEDDELWDDVA